MPTQVRGFIRRHGLQAPEGALAKDGLYSLHQVGAAWPRPGGQGRRAPGLRPTGLKHLSKAASAFLARLVLILSLKYFKAGTGRKY